MASAVRFFVVFSSACGYIFTNKVDKTTMKLKDELSTEYPVWDGKRTKNNRKIIRKIKNRIDKTL